MYVISDFSFYISHMCRIITVGYVNTVFPMIHFADWKGEN